MRQLVSSGSPYEPKIGFSRAVKVGNGISVSGTAPIGEDGATIGLGDAAAQTRRCLAIIGDALAELGASLAHVTRTRIYLTNRNDWQAVGQAMGEAFGNIRPASTMVVVSGFIDPTWLVEIEADAVIE